MALSARAVTFRGRSLMKVLTETPFYLVKRVVEEMTPEEARDVWSHIEPFFAGVCARASPRKRDAWWLILVRKMNLIKRKADEALEAGNCILITSRSMAVRKGDAGGGNS